MGTSNGPSGANADYQGENRAGRGWPSPPADDPSR